MTSELSTAAEDRTFLQARADLANAKYAAALKKIYRLEDNLTNLQIILHERDQLIKQQLGTINTILSSTSWRLTALPRFILNTIYESKNFLRFKNFLNLSPQAKCDSVPKAKSPAEPIEASASANALEQTENMQMAFLAWHSEVPIYFDRDAPPEVSIIVPVYGCLEELECCLRSIVLSKNKLNIEVILIDDKPDSPVVPLIPSSPGLVKIVNNENIGFLLSCNKAAQIANGKLLLFLNTDVILAFGSIDALIAALKEYPNAGMVGGMLLNNDGTVQDAGWKINIDGSGDPIGRGDCPTDHLTRKVVDCVTGACFLITKQLWSTLGGFDTIYAPAYYEEFDLAFRARQLGLVTIYEPRCRVVHLGARSYGTVNRDVMSQNNRMVFLRRFEKILGSG